VLRMSLSNAAHPYIICMFNFALSQESNLSQAEICVSRAIAAAGRRNRAIACLEESSSLIQYACTLLFHQEVLEWIATIKKILSQKLVFLGVYQNICIGPPRIRPCNTLILVKRIT
jgi:hypothetical protein